MSMKVKDLTTELIMLLDEDELQEVKWILRPALTCSRKTLKNWQAKPIKNDRDAKSYAGTRRAVAHQEAMLEAIMCRQDELYGPGVLSTYDHSQCF
jgi:hypothetical protein